MDGEVICVIENKLYDYIKMKKRIKTLEENLYNDFSYSKYFSKYKKGYLIEDRLVDIIDQKESLKKWQELINKVLVYFFEKNPKYYQFIKCKYFSKRNAEEIEERLKIDLKEQENINKIIIDFVYKNAKLRHLI